MCRRKQQRKGHRKRNIRFQDGHRQQKSVPFHRQVKNHHVRWGSLPQDDFVITNGQHVAKMFDEIMHKFPDFYQFGLMADVLSQQNPEGYAYFLGGVMMITRICSYRTNQGSCIITRRLKTYQSYLILAQQYWCHPISKTLTHTKKWKLLD